MAPDANATQQPKPSKHESINEHHTNTTRHQRVATSRSARSRTIASSELRGFARLRHILQDPKAFQEFRKSLPSWTDEVGAFGLILMGLLLFSALLNPTGDIAAPVAEALRIAFGGGAFVLATAVILFGAILLLPRAGFSVNLSWSRVLGFEVFLMALLALFHMLTFSDEPRALARAGEGGGYVGWAISSLTIGWIGEVSAILLFTGIVLFSFGTLIGIQRRDVRAVILGLSDMLGGVANWLRPTEFQRGGEQDVIDHPLDAVEIDQNAVDDQPAQVDDLALNVADVGPTKAPAIDETTQLASTSMTHRRRRFWQRKRKQLQTDKSPVPDERQSVVIQPQSKSAAEPRVVDDATETQSQGSVNAEQTTPTDDVV